MMLLLCLAAGMAAAAQGSCKGGCKYVRGASCQCNSRCSKYNDCCADYDKYCNKPSPPSPPSPHPHPSPPAPTPPSGPTGGPEQHHLALTASPDMVTCSFATARSYTEPPTCKLGGAPG